MAIAAVNPPAPGAPSAIRSPNDLSENQNDILEVLSSTAALLTARGIAEHVLDDAPQMADVLLARDNLEILVDAGLVVATQKQGGIKVYGLREFFPHA